MKLAVLAPENSPSWGGVGSYTYNLINNLPDDVDIHVITIDRNVDDSFDKILENNEIKIHKIVKISSNDSFFCNLKFQMALLRKIRKLNELYGFDLIHSHSGHLPHYFSQFLNIAPMVVTVHAETKGWKESRNLVKYNKERTEVLSDLFSYFIASGEKTTFKRSDRLLPISKFTLNQISHVYDVDTTGRAEVVHNGVDTELFKPEDIERDNEITISFLGRFNSIKGPEIFLKAIKMVKDEEYPVKILLGGRGNDAYLKKFLHSTDYTSFFGRIDYYNMPNIYNKSDIVISPSLYEGCSGTILEAMACEKIVIGSEVGGTPEIIEDNYNGFLFKPRNPVDLAKKIIDVIEETIDINKIMKNGRKTAINKFDWKQKGEEVYNNYLKAV